MITDKYFIREKNEALVLNTIIREENISRAQISSITGLNKASVSEITKKLIEEQLVSEVGEGESNKVGGRKPIILTFNKRAGLALSIDIGPDYINGMVTYLDGKVIANESFIDIHITSTNVFTYIVALYTQLSLQKFAKVPHGIVGMSIAIHGVVQNNKIILTPNYAIGNEFLTQLKEYFSFPIYLENEANLAALGEYSFGEESKHLVSLNIQTGIGSGFIQNGVIYEGSRGNSGEVGHTTIVPNGKLCSCGNRGCLERYASLSTLMNEVKQVMEVDTINVDDLKTLYFSNTTIESLLNQNAFYLSIAITNLAVLFDPEIIIINNPLYKAIPKLMEVVKKELTSSFIKDIEVRTSKLTYSATLIGGVANVVKQFLNIDDLKLIK